MYIVYCIAIFSIFKLLIWVSISIKNMIFDRYLDIKWILNLKDTCDQKCSNSITPKFILFNFSSSDTNNEECPDVFDYFQYQAGTTVSTTP